MTREELMKSTIEQQIEFAAGFLDAIEPNWFQRVNLDRLNMSSVEDCVLGQVFGGYGKGKKILIENGWNYDFHWDHPFCLHTSTWKIYILNRQQEFQMNSFEKELSVPPSSKLLVIINGVPQLVEENSVVVVKRNATAEDLRMLEFGLNFKK